MILSLLLCHLLAETVPVLAKLRVEIELEMGLKPVPFLSVETELEMEHVMTLVSAASTPDSTAPKTEAAANPYPYRCLPRQELPGGLRV